MMKTVNTITPFKPMEMKTVASTPVRPVRVGPVDVQAGRLTLLARGVGLGTATKGGAGWLTSA